MAAAAEPSGAQLRTSAIGEVHSGEESGRRLEAAIEALLAEDGAACPKP